MLITCSVSCSFSTGFANAILDYLFLFSVTWFVKISSFAGCHKYFRCLVYFNYLYFMFLTKLIGYFSNSCYSLCCGRHLRISVFSFCFGINSSNTLTWRNLFLENFKRHNSIEKCVNSSHFSLVNIYVIFLVWMPDWVGFITRKTNLRFL